ncbi:MAG: YncE family protein [Solirubrobacteraceae bacterium]
MTPIDPLTGRPRGRAIPVRDPYNLYFTPDGRRAIVVAEAQRRLDFRDARTMRLRSSVAVGCVGVDHMDFAANGAYAYATCEFDGTVLELDLRTLKIVRRLRLHSGVASPQDIKLAPDGRLLYVADQLAGGLWEIDPQTLRKVGFLRTGLGAHGLYPSRDARLLYASNRAEGSVSVISFATRRVLRKWRLPRGSSPDMGGVSVDGRTLWLSGRYNSEVYAIDTASGRLRARIPVGQGPHGLSVWPQPGRYSLGHTGVTR